MAQNPRGAAPSRTHQPLPDRPPTVAEKLDAITDHLIEIRRMLEVLAHPPRWVTPVEPLPKDQAEFEQWARRHEKLADDLEAIRRIPPARVHPVGHPSFVTVFDEISASGGPVNARAILNRDDPGR